MIVVARFCKMSPVKRKPVFVGFDQKDSHRPDQPKQLVQRRMFFGVPFFRIL